MNKQGALPWVKHPEWGTPIPYSEIFAQPVKNGSQAANERFFDFPEIKLIYRFLTFF
jgi:hypothetical protein